MLKRRIISASKLVGAIFRHPFRLTSALLSRTGGQTNTNPNCQLVTGNAIFEQFALQIAQRCRGQVQVQLKRATELKQQGRGEEVEVTALSLLH